MLKYFNLIKTRGLFIFICASINSIIITISRLFNKKFIVKNIYDFKLKLDLSDPGISRSLILFGQRELEHKKMLEMYLKPGMSVYDIGANIGYYTCIQHNILKGNGKIVAIEPSPINFEQLRDNIELNNLRNIKIINAAVGDKNSVEKFFLAKESNLNSFHNIGTGKKFLTGKTINVEVKTVPQIYKDTNIKPDLIRMDVEGHEVEVINGMLEEISNKNIKPAIIFETHLSRYSEQHNISESLTKLFEYGYKCELVGSSSEKGSQIIEQNGYKSLHTFNTDGMERKIFSNLQNDLIVNMISKSGGIRTILLT